MMDCKVFQKKLPDLVLDPGAPANAAALEHTAGCPPCGEEYGSLIATMSLMDAWTAPNPSPYFDQKLAVLLREEMAAPRLGFFARVRDRLLFNTGRQFRPALAGGLALVLMVGGGSYAGFSNGAPWYQRAQVSATVNDLQILDKNETALQQMDQLLQDDDDSADVNAPS